MYMYIYKLRLREHLGDSHVLAEEVLPQPRQIVPTHAGLIQHAYLRILVYLVIHDSG